jgi:hypothetical protein
MWYGRDLAGTDVSGGEGSMDIFKGHIISTPSIYNVNATG